MHRVNIDLSGRGHDNTGVSILRYINISILIKYYTFSGFYKKLGLFYKKLICDKFGNGTTSTKNACNNQIQSSIKQRGGRGQIPKNTGQGHSELNQLLEYLEENQSFTCTMMSFMKTRTFYI